MTNNVVSRVGTNIHEAWHAWEHWQIHLFGISHKTRNELPECLPPNTCNCTAGKSPTNDNNDKEICDYFYTHPLDTFRPFGTLWEPGVRVISDCPFAPRLCAAMITPEKFHSPNQIKWEYMCDLMNSPAQWVTQDILNNAQLAQNITEKYFIQLPAMTCGSVSPMMGPM
jgi:hypothetical protein